MAERRLPPVTAVLLAILSVQGGAAIAKGLFPVLGSLTTTALRICLSAVMLLALFRPSSREVRHWRFVVPYGLVLAAMNFVFYLSLARIPLGLAVALEFVGPLALAVLSSRRPLDFLWVAMAAAGIWLIHPRGDGGLDMLGAVFALLAGGLWAAYIVLGGRLSREVASGTAVALGLSVAAVAVLPFTVASGGLARLTPPLFAAGAAVALLSSAIPFTLEMQALSAMPARTFSVLMSLEPAAAALCGLIFLDERLTAAQWAAVALVIAASAGAAATARAVTAHVES